MHFKFIENKEEDEEEGNYTQKWLIVSFCAFGQGCVLNIFQFWLNGENKCDKCIGMRVKPNTDI